jgi:hypothetical protein
MVRIPILIILPTLILLSGCVGIAGSASIIIKADADVVFSSSNYAGGDHATGAVWITDEKGFVSALNMINGLKLGGSAVSAPGVDFGHYGVLLVRMGRKPTSGYGIELASKEVDVQNQTAVVKVRWIEPARGAILAQMITNPCLMIKIAKGSYTSIRVVDQNGIVRAETKMERS